MAFFILPFFSSTVKTTGLLDIGKVRYVCWCCMKQLKRQPKTSTYTWIIHAKLFHSLHFGV